MCIRDRCMSYSDQIFIQNCRDILDNGVWDTDYDVRPVWEDGTPAHTIKRFGIVNRYDLSKEFPVITLRRTAFKSADVYKRQHHIHIPLYIRLLLFLSIWNPAYSSYAQKNLTSHPLLSSQNHGPYVHLNNRVRLSFLRIRNVWPLSRYYNTFHRAWYGKRSCLPPQPLSLIHI